MTTLACRSIRRRGSRRPTKRPPEKSRPATPSPACPATRNSLGPDSIETFALVFCLKNHLRFNFDSVTYLNCPFFIFFLSQCRVCHDKTQAFFQRKSQAKDILELNCVPALSPLAKLPQLSLQQSPKLPSPSSRQPLGLAPRFPQGLNKGAVPGAFQGCFFILSGSSSPRGGALGGNSMSHKSIKKLLNTT